MLADIGLAFVEGLGLIVSPCILPILPIVLSAGITGDKLKPYGIILGFIIAFTAFTLFSRQLILAFNIDPDIIRHVSFFILIVFGLVLISTTLSNLFARLTQNIANIGEKYSARAGTHQGFVGGLLLGIPIGLIWVPCAGPIIAAVVIQTIRAQTGIDTFLNLLAFSLGSGLPMLLIATQGQRLVTKMSFLKKHSETIRRCAGVLIIATVILTAQGMFLVNPAMAQNEKSVQLQNGISAPYPAPDIAGITAWINSPPLTLEQLRGKVVLIDFWTFSCINCIRTLPSITTWDHKYRNQGLVIIGVHAPEFPFEQKLDNVQQAVARYGIHYPVALDNNFTTWTNFHNSAWPAHYLIDRSGKVVYTHFGEGDYGITENNIRVLLGQTMMKEMPKEAVPFSILQTEETYLGTDRAAHFASTSSLNNSYQYPSTLDRNEWALQGEWQRDSQKITAQQAGAAIKLHFYAKNVFLVLNTTDKRAAFATIKLNGKLIGIAGGKDVHNSQLAITSDRLYELVNLPSAQDGTVEIIAQQPRLSAYAFTFGS
jgi:cytochrome c biogenesis protein CcdA/thiol-disulfide isomerase/thioredoxin